MSASLSVGEIRDVLYYDPDTGIFRWKRRSTINNRLISRWNGKFAGKIAGGDQRGYIIIRITPHGNFYAHRLAWLLVYGQWPKHNIDHIDGNGTNNRIANLRSATQAENNQNKRARKSVKSGIKGVYPHGKGWRSRIGVYGKDICLGTFGSKEEAAAAYASAAQKYFGTFARTF